MFIVFIVLISTCFLRRISADCSTELSDDTKMFNSKLWGSLRQVNSITNPVLYLKSYGNVSVMYENTKYNLIEKINQLETKLNQCNCSC